MGEKSGGLWLIVVVVILAGLLIAGLIFIVGDEKSGAIKSISDMFNNMLDSTEGFSPSKP